MITYVKGKTDVLSNFYPVLLNNNGITFKSAEHMYQSQKAIFHEEYELNAKIIIAHNAQNAKKLSKSIKTCVEWEQMKPIVQAEILKIKFVQFEEFRDILMASEGYIAHNVCDTFWGTGFDGKGHNVFGLLLAALRLGVK